MAREPSWTKDSFLSDFLFDTDQVAVDRSESASTGYPDLDLLSADDVSLTSYLSGDKMIGTTEKAYSTSKSSPSLSPKLIDPDVELIEEEPQRPIIVVTRSPANPKINRGSSSSRQAVAARENRQKKKQYLSGLEASVQSLSQENEQLKLQNNRQQQKIVKYKEEVKYLKSVIANESALSALLTNIQNASGVKLAASLMPAVDENTLPVFGQKRKLPHSVRDGSSVQETASQDKGTSSTKRLCVTPNIGNAISPSQRQQLQNISCSESLNSLDGLADNAASTSSGNEDLLIVETSTCEASAAKSSTRRAEKRMKSAIGSESDTADNESDDGDTSGGICLHVLGDSVSIEFCATCNRSAVKSCSRDHAYFKSRD